MPNAIWERAAVAVLLFLLMSEWLLPLAALSDVTTIYQIRPFLWIIAIFMLLHLLPISGFWIWLGKVVVALYAISCIFYPGVAPIIPDTAVWSGWMRALALDFSYMWAGQWMYLSDLLRTFVFLMGWATAGSLAFPLVYERRQVAWIILMTWGYLLLLQQLMDLQITVALWRSMFFGLLLSALLFGAQLRQYAVGTVKGWRFKWWGVSVAVVLVMVTAAWSISPMVDARPQQSAWTASWPMNELWQGISSMPARTGFSPQPRALGGSIRPDNRLVFRATTSALTYWRADSLHYYNGQGWQRLAHTPADLRLMDVTSQEDWGDEAVTQQIELVDMALGRHLLAGGPIVQLDHLADERGIPQPIHMRWLQPQRDGIALQWTGPKPLQTYRLMAIPYAMGPHTSSIAHAGESYSIQHDLQLPESITPRVYELAREIAGVGDPRDQAERLRQFLIDNYTYSMEGIGYPDPDQDFVDHFLFDQQTGYCDHFSTAYTIMLRAVGIPARWARGFAVGDVVEQTPEGDYVVEVRAKHAHSWTEAYFVESGWVTLEPTPSFSGQTEAVELISGVESIPPAVESSRAHPFGKSASYFMKFVQQAQALFGQHTALVLAVLCWLLAAASLVSYMIWRQHWGDWRRRFLSRRWLQRWQIDQNRQRLLQIVWREIFGKFGTKLPTTTHREYVEMLIGAGKCEPQQQHILQHLLICTEASYYGGDQAQTAQQTLQLSERWRTRWLRLMKTPLVE